MSGLLRLVTRGARRLGGFSVSTVLLALASLFFMPAIIGAAGLETWSSIVLGQALAQIGATVVGWGYGVSGPAAVARLTTAEAAAYFRLAENTKFRLAIPCLALITIAMFTIPNPHPIAGLLGGAPLLIGALSAIFFYIGRAAPRWLLLAETCPRVIGLVAGAIVLVAGGPLLLGLALPVLGTIAAITISYVTIQMSAKSTRPRPRRIGVRAILTELQTQRGAAAASMLRGGRDALPVLVLTAVSADLVGAFGIFDRIQRQALGALAPVTSTLQGWVPRKMAASSNSARPTVVAAVAGIIGSLVIFLIFTLLGSPFVTWFAAGTIKPNSSEIVLCGAVIATGMLIQIVAYACMVPLGGMRGLVAGNAIGIITILVIIPTILLFERSVTFVLGALVIANLSQLALQILLWLRLLADRRQRY